jgi:hypothetical protein
MPLTYAASKGLAGTVVKLLTHGAETDRPLNNSDLLECAFKSGGMETIQVVIAHLADSAEGREMLRDGLRESVILGMGSAQDDYLAYAEMLLDAGVAADVTIVRAEGTTPLMLLAKHADEKMRGAIPMASMLIARGADVQRKDAKGETALDIARANGYQPMIDLLSGGAPASTSSSSSTLSFSSGS